MRRIFAALGFTALAACGSPRGAPAGDAGKREASPSDGARRDAPAPTCTLAVPAPASSRLVARGPALVDALGRTVFLRGVDAGGRSKFAPYVPFDFEPGKYASALDAYMSRAQSWGIDAMRVPFTWAALESTEGTYDAAWLAMYDELLASAWAHGIYTVLDFHQDVYSEVYCGDGFPAWTVKDPPAPHHDCPNWQFEYFSDSSVQAAFDAFWSDSTGLYPKYLSAWDTMIARFEDTPGVLGFEIINEPAAGTANESTFEATTLSAFYAKVAAHMRAKAPDDLVFVDGTELDGVNVSTELVNPHVPGVVFAPHYYPILAPSPEDLAKALGAWQTIGQSWNVPVFLGEFGMTSTKSGAEAYVASVFAGVDSLGWSGATEWEYSASKQLWDSENFSVVGGDGTEQPTARALIRPYARAVAGTAIRQSWDPPSATFSLSYAPAQAGTGVSEVRLPARAYPSGYTVSLVGGCYDGSSAKGELLIQPDPGATAVTLKVTP
jgi:endoglycosylceramidase